jgi:hypothetical protein
MDRDFQFTEVAGNVGDTGLVTSTAVRKHDD